MQRWDEITGAVTGEAFDYLPNFWEISVGCERCAKLSQEDDFASSLTLLALALHRLKIIISLKSQVRFILLKACFFFFTATSHCLFHDGTVILRDFLDCGIAFQSSFANTSFKEAIGVAQWDGERSQSLITGGVKFLPVCFGEVPYWDTMVFRCGVRIDICWNSRMVTAQEFVCYCAYAEGSAWARDKAPCIMSSEWKIRWCSSV